MTYILIYFTNNEDIIEIYIDTGIVLIYLSSYSSDLNFIKEIFIQFKQWIQKHYILITSCDNFKQFL